MKIDIEKMTKNRIRFLKECIVIHPVRFTSFAGHLKKLPVASKNFAIYAFKNREVLHYNSMGAFVVEQLTFHSKNALRQLAAGKVRSALISIIWLCYGVPLNCLNLSKLKTFDRKGGFSVI
jgi:hypothetical protein